ncbi:E3 ubiquitin-protein ligase RHA1B-like [Corylus avellana]|uniref:E3 ubiquitin-protein ligase RHA1B-like n=1 Tax=Corylus avellana TaxID=13451 RepID=UPI00286CECE2|nr:E3 ubiquitin-protein ligase RHA1B-like [Corylus avellana]
MPLSEGEMCVTFGFEPEYPEEGDIIPVHVPVQRSLLSSEESAKSIIPLLRSRMALPSFFRRHILDEFIKDLWEYVCSLPSDMHHVHVYGYVFRDVFDPDEGFCWYYFWTEDLISTTDGPVMTSPRWSESAVQAVKLEEALDCAICLQELPVAFEAAKLPCSHVYHRRCIVKWFDRSNQCPLCRSPAV